MYVAGMTHQGSSTGSRWEAWFRSRSFPARTDSRNVWLAALVLLVAISGCAGRPHPSLPSTPSAPTTPSRPSETFRPGRLPLVRIGLLVNRPSVRVTGTGSFKVVDQSSGEVIGTSSRGMEWNLQSNGAWIDASTPEGDAQGLYTGPILVSPAGREGRIRISKKEYRGTVEVSVNQKGTLTVVNILDLESYLRGVVPLEIGKLKDTQIEALKTQAVAARTYAVSNLGRRKALGFDLYSTVADQVYEGFSAEWAVADRAIAETRGMVAIYEGKPIDAFYSSTCGGETESIEEGWGSRPVSYLRNVRDRDGRSGDFCRDSPVYKWSVEWNRKTLENILSSSLPGLDKRKAGELSLHGIDVRKRSRSGRVQELEIRTNHGTSTLRGDKIRSALRRPVRGRPLLRSTKFDLKIRGDTIVAEGGGYGHGIGLCQMGAIGMAAQGYKYDKILKHYYRGVDLRRAY